MVSSFNSWISFPLKTKTVAGVHRDIGYSPTNGSMFSKNVDQFTPVKHSPLKFSGSVQISKKKLGELSNYILASVPERNSNTLSKLNDFFNNLSSEEEKKEYARHFIVSGAGSMFSMRISPLAYAVRSLYFVESDNRASQSQQDFYRGVAEILLKNKADLKTGPDESENLLESIVRQNQFPAAKRRFEVMDWLLSHLDEEERKSAIKGTKTVPFVVSVAEQGDVDTLNAFLKHEKTYVENVIRDNFENYLLNSLNQLQAQKPQSSNKSVKLNDSPKDIADKIVGKLTSARTRETLRKVGLGKLYGQLAQKYLDELKKRETKLAMKFIAKIAMQGDVETLQLFMNRQKKDIEKLIREDFKNYYDRLLKKLPTFKSQDPNHVVKDKDFAEGYEIRDYPLGRMVDKLTSNAMKSFIQVGLGELHKQLIEEYLGRLDEMGAKPELCRDQTPSPIEAALSTGETGLEIVKRLSRFEHRPTVGTINKTVEALRTKKAGISKNLQKPYNQCISDLQNLSSAWKKEEKEKKHQELTQKLTKKQKQKEINKAKQELLVQKKAEKKAKEENEKLKKLAKWEYWGRKHLAAMLIQSVFRKHQDDIKKKIAEVKESHSQKLQEFAREVQNQENKVANLEKVASGEVSEYNLKAEKAVLTMLNTVLDTHKTLNNDMTNPKINALKNTQISKILKENILIYINEIKRKAQTEFREMQPPPIYNSFEEYLEKNPNNS